MLIHEESFLEFGRTACADLEMDGVVSKAAFFSTTGPSDAKSRPSGRVLHLPASRYQGTALEVPPCE